MDVKLADIQPGERATIVKIEGRARAGGRLAEMGATRGTPLEVVRVAPLGDPVEIKIRGYHLSLRKEEAQGVWVTRGAGSSKP